MIQAKQGDTVKIHYIGKFDDGTEFATSINAEPLQFTIGQGQVIPGLELAGEYVLQPVAVGQRLLRRSLDHRSVSDGIAIPNECLMAGICTNMAMSATSQASAMRSHLWGGTEKIL